jgi:hypothetical protein
MTNAVQQILLTSDYLLKCVSRDFHLSGKDQPVFLKIGPLLSTSAGILEQFKGC